MNLPFLEACFNGLSIILMVGAIVAIKQKKPKIHQYLMSGAVVSSAFFLTCYLIYHFTHDSIPYTGVHVVFYRVILISHIILAIMVPFLVGITVFRAWKGRFVDHKRIAKITFPIWLYVSVTGIVVYLMVHQGTI